MSGNPQKFADEEGFALEGLQEAVQFVRERVLPHTWKAFLLFEFFEMTAKEIAPLLEMKPTAVNQAVFRVRQLLQQAFIDIHMALWYFPGFITL